MIEKGIFWNHSQIHDNFFFIRLVMGVEKKINFRKFPETPSE